MDTDLLPVLTRIAEALDRLAPAPPDTMAFDMADAFVWHPDGMRLQPVAHVAAVRLALLKGITPQRERLLSNTLQFAAGRPANNAMLWGARGNGKSSLIKAVHAEVLRLNPSSLALIEIAREDIVTLPILLNFLRATSRRCIVFCDDLSFEREDADYKALKSVLDGGIEGRPSNVLFYATSNRRHLMPREMIENERGSAIHPGEAVEEKISLSDRFGLWIGFHSCDQPTFFEMVDAYGAEFDIPLDPAALHAEAVAWSAARGGRSGRVAWQFIQDLSGRLGSHLK